MAKTSQEYEKEMIDGLKAATGKDLAGWQVIIKKSGIIKRNDIIAWLKNDHGFAHTNASLLAGVYLNGGKPVYGNSDELIDNQFKGKEDMRPLYDQLKMKIAGTSENWQFIPTKLFTSIRNGKEFAAIIVKKGELKLAMDLGDQPFENYFSQARSLGPMPRISHTVSIKSASDITQKLIDWLKKADSRVNPK